MMLKKQTVWLLTMLSLMIVLSVYYMTSPGNEGQFAFIDQGEKEQTEALNENQANETVETQGSEQQNTVTSSIGTDELFTYARLQIQDERSLLKEQLKNVVASTNSSPDQVNEAMSEIRQLEKLSTRESILEQTIQADAEYQDVLVRAEEDAIDVTVKANKLTKTEANHIIQMTKDEFGEVWVNVSFQPYN